MGVNAQEIFEKGTQLFKLGVGVNANGTPLEVSYENGVKEDFQGGEGLVLGLGGNLGYYGYKQDFSNLAGSYSWKYINIIVAGHALYHNPLIDKLDTYTGVLINIYLQNVRFLYFLNMMIYSGDIK